ncbi:DgyrCDS1372 [Dimorphilus gyrociliatus]|uniref:DgyrCDS1372 n=1 Tax=Dimorphilus gyrociliatus TaxID=2664684 RepID=A0A7I8V9Z6_9ANNE|nr:DgyrCDS1372 [Dimorphilus gyrociliatus]
MSESEKIEKSGYKIIDVQEVYAKSRHEYPLSRNAAVYWYFNNLNKPLPLTTDAMLGAVDEEVEILSIGLSKVHEDEIANHEDIENASIHLKIIPSTKITFLSNFYKFVIVLDMKPSLFSSVRSESDLGVNEMIRTVIGVIKSLVSSCPISSKVSFSPKVYITVLAFCPHCKPLVSQVLLQGVCTTETNIEEVTKSLKEQFDKFISNFIEVRCLINEEYNGQDSFPLDVDQMGKVPHASAHLINMITYGFFAMNLLPDVASPGIVIVSDGVFSQPDPINLDKLLTQLRNASVRVFVINMSEVNNGNPSSLNDFGVLSSSDFLHFLTTATVGACLSKRDIDLIDRTSKETANICQKRLFFIRIQPLSLFGVVHQSKFEFPQLKKKYIEGFPVKVNAAELISVRLREGYVIERLQLIPKGEGQINVYLSVPWRDSVKIAYIIRSPWPFNNNKSTYVDISIEGNYSVLHDLICARNQALPSKLLTLMKTQFWKHLASLTETDKLLLHFTSFLSNPIFFNIPNSLKQGVNLFDLASHPNASSTPQLSTQLNPNDVELSEFAAFWEPTVMIDIRMWRKWLHVHQIILVLEHERPIAENVYYPNASGRYVSITARKATTDITLHFLGQYSSFVLVESLSYIKFIYEDDEKSEKPCSFCVIKVAANGPLFILKLAFLGGTSSVIRHKTYNDLRMKLLNLKLPISDSERENFSRSIQKQFRNDHSLNESLGKTGKSRSRVGSAVEINLCTQIKTPLQHALVRYDDLFNGKSDSPPSASLQSHLALKYLLYRRNIWTIQPCSQYSLSSRSLGMIASVLSKKRQNEGFKFAYGCQGFVNMVIELDMTEKNSTIPSCSLENDPRENELLSCLVQYVLLPPTSNMHGTSERISENGEEEDNENSETDQELQLITECWVEPQHGFVETEDDEKQDLAGCTSQEITKAVIPIDTPSVQ